MRYKRGLFLWRGFLKIRIGRERQRLPFPGRDCGIFFLVDETAFVINYIKIGFSLNPFFSAITCLASLLCLRPPLLSTAHPPLAVKPMRLDLLDSDLLSISSAFLRCALHQPSSFSPLFQRMGSCASLHIWFLQWCLSCCFLQVTMLLLQQQAGSQIVCFNNRLLGRPFSWIFFSQDPVDRVIC